MLTAATIINTVAVVALAIITTYYAIQTARQAAAARETVYLMHRQWIAHRRAGLVPIQISLRLALKAVGDSEANLGEVLGRASAGFGSAVVEEPAVLNDALTGSRTVSIQLYDAISAALAAIREAARLANRPTDGRRPHEAWREALANVNVARNALEDAIAIAAAELAAAGEEGFSSR